VTLQYQSDWVAKWAVYSPDQIAVKEFESGNSLTYQQLNRAANRLSYELTRSFGLQKGDRIAVLADNCLEYILLFAVAQKTGIILVPLNYRLTSPEIDYLLENAAPRLVVHEEKYAALLNPCKHLEHSRRWTIEALGAFCNTQTYTPSTDDYYTSGTTGFPKGAVYSHKMLFWNSINTAISLIVTAESRTVNCMPPFHTGGWNVLVTPFLHHGGYVCLMKKFDPEDILRALQEEEPTIFMGVPTMLKIVTECPGFAEADFSSLLYIIVGGEPMPIPLIETWHAKGVFIRQGFGMTEVGPNLTSLHHLDAVRKKGSIGRPNFYVEIRIVDPEGNDVPPGEAGELLLKGPMVMPGYWQNEKATQAAIRDGWYYSGDMVRMDAEGYIYVVDRIKNMFISGGENVYPAEIERILVSHPGITAAAVIGVPDSKWGEVGKAFIVRAPEAQVDEQQVREFCTAQMARYKIPKQVVFVDQLPVSATGKINRLALKDSV
jgi:fatty-acyl-CoA synthase